MEPEGSRGSFRKTIGTYKTKEKTFPQSSRALTMENQDPAKLLLLAPQHTPMLNSVILSWDKLKQEKLLTT